MSFQPLRDYVVVSKQAEEDKVAGGLLYRPATASETKIVKGTVLAVGTGQLSNDGASVPLEVKVGDTVMFNKNFATEITDGSETVLLIREDQLYCIIR
jgi:chaperonin GroES